jgi:hypothetical protein
MEKSTTQLKIVIHKPKTAPRRPFCFSVPLLPRYSVSILTFRSFSVGRNFITPWSSCASLGFRPPRRALLAPASILMLGPGQLTASVTIIVTGIHNLHNFRNLRRLMRNELDEKIGQAT